MEIFNNEFVTLYNCDSRQIPIPDGSVDCVVTSPPYYGLRDYGINGQIGLEESPEEYANTMVEVFREVWRVLKPTGTVWLNLGDSYSSQGGAEPEQTVRKSSNYVNRGQLGKDGVGTSRKAVPGLKPKDLVGIPWKVAFALQADGWYLRSDIIWSKPNPMPESVHDRPTKAHEYIFLLTKSPKYYYDADAIREITGKEASWDNYGGKGMIDHPTGPARKQIDLTIGTSQKKAMPYISHPNGRNKRSVWTINTQPYPEAHFATFPEKLIEPCILAGCPKDGVVLDPFVGSGTTAAVAQKYGRKSVGVDLNKEYLDIAVRRITSTQPVLL